MNEVVLRCVCVCVRAHVCVCTTYCDVQFVDACTHTHVWESIWCYYIISNTTLLSTICLHCYYLRTS